MIDLLSVVKVPPQLTTLEYVTP